MKISIITATFNCKKSIPATLESIASQTHSDIEHIIIDGRSTDGTLDVISGWKGHKFYLESSNDMGIYDALNKGINKAQGDVVGFLHGDDFLNDKFVISKIANLFENKNVQIVYGDLNYVGSSDATKVVRRWSSGSFELSKLKYGWMPPHPTFYASKGLYMKYGGFDIKYKISADYDSMLRILKSVTLSHQSIKYIPEVLVNMRMGGVSNKSLTNILCKMVEDLKIVKKNGVGGILTILFKNTRKIGQLF